MKTVVVLYGGRSGEHEVSRISASSIVRHLDRNKYELVLVGISKTGEWLLQDSAALRNVAEESGAQGKDPGMSGLPPITGGIPVCVLPSRGLFAANGSGGLSSLNADIVFPVLHGTFGEDGTVQGLLECSGLPYVGAGVLGSAVGMDKEITKEIWLSAGLDVVDFLCVRNRDMENSLFLANLIRKIEARFGWPCFVKPARSGSSVGASRANNAEELPAALSKAFVYDTKVLVERYMNAREVECAVLGNGSPQAFPPGEIVPTHEFYDYEAKYKDPDGARLQVPADLSPSQAEQIRGCAVKAYKACELNGMARVDFFIEKRTGKAYLNEVNTIPGFTAISMYPRMCAAGGLSYPALLDELIRLGLELSAERKSLSYSFPDA